MTVIALDPDLHIIADMVAQLVPSNEAYISSVYALVSNKGFFGLQKVVQKYGDISGFNRIAVLW